MKPQKIPVRYLYHGSGTELAVGDLLLPPCITGARGDFDANRNQVYLTTDITYAVAMATENGEQGWLYRARPLGAVEEHVSDIIFSGIRGTPAGGTHYTCSKAEIVARAPVPQAFVANRNPLIEAHFKLVASLSTKADVFSRKLLNADEPDDPNEWLVARGRGEEWKETRTPWAWFQDADAKEEQMRILFGRLHEFLEDHREEIIDAADDTPSILRELLDVVGFRTEICGDCGNILNDTDMRRGDGFCIGCEAEQPD